MGGVIEPLQSKYTIQELIEELRCQIGQYCSKPITLIGHSWGAWLSGLTAAKHPHLVNKLILIGCAPLEVQYVGQIDTRRKNNLTATEGREFDQLIYLLESAVGTDKGSVLRRLAVLADKSDYYDRQELVTDASDALQPDGVMYSKIWSEAAKLRESGELITSFRKITCPVTLIQGADDPHPYNGITEPLATSPVKSYIIDKCGHTPWKEKQASKRFFEILVQEIRP